jgi:hypothetical protein
MAAEPKAEWFVLGNCFQEVGEALEILSGGIARPATGLNVSRAPSFSGEPNGVTGLFENIGIDWKLFRQEAVEISAFFEAMRRLAGRSSVCG